MDTVTGNFQYYAIPLPGFNEETFPFIALCGGKNISILNVKSYTQKPLINQELIWRAGLQTFAVKTEK